MPIFFDYTVALIGDYSVRLDPNISIDDELNDAPNAARFTVEDEEPPIGQLIRIVDPATRKTLFGGSVVVTEQRYDEGDLTWAVDATDGEWLLNRRRPFGQWTDKSASTVVANLIANFTAGFTGNHVASGLPNITISFDGTQNFAACLSAICAAVGGCVWSVDYTRDIWLGYDNGVEEVTDDFNGDGVSTVFTLRHPLVLTPISGTLGRGYVTYDNGAGPVNETLALTGGGGTWEYDFGTNQITRTTGAPVDSGLLHNISIIYSTSSSLNVIDDDDPLLLRDPAPALRRDGTQVRNRVYVVGVGTTSRTDSQIGFTVILVEDATPFKAGVKVRFGADIFTVASVQYGDNAFVQFTGAITKTYAAGTSMRLWVEVNDAAAQADLAAVEGGDGIHETVLNFDDWLISDDVLETVFGDRATAELAALTTRANAEVAMWASPQESVSYATRDANTRSGSIVTFNLTEPPIVGAFKVQSVRIDQIDEGQDGEVRLVPRFNVTASAVRFDLVDLLRKVIISDSSGGSNSSSGGFGGGGGAAGPPGATGRVNLALLIALGG